MLIPEHLLWHESNSAVARDGALEQVRSVELVTSSQVLVNYNSFLSLLESSLEVHCWVDLIFILSLHRFFIFFMIANLNLFTSPVLLLVVCLC